MAAEQTESRREFKPGDIVKHFKREFLKGEMFRTSSKYLYKIIGIAEHTETKEKVVVYQALYKSEKDNVNFGLYVRPYDMFMSEVDHEKYPMVKQKYRFEKVIPGQTDSGMDIAKTSVETPEKAEVLPESVTLPEEERPNPDLMEFLDADTFEQKKRILVGMRNRITDRLIDDLAAALDVTVEDGDLDERYRNLLFCVDTMERFEVNRLR